MSVYSLTIERLNEETGEPECINRLTLIEQAGPLKTGTKFYQMINADGLNELVVRDPGESVFALAASAWEKYDHATRMKVRRNEE